jgi:hypothetical protein
MEIPGSLNFFDQQLRRILNAKYVLRIEPAGNLTEQNCKASRWNEMILLIHEHDLSHGGNV